MLGLDSFTVGLLGVALLIVLVFAGVRVFVAAAITGFLGLLASSASSPSMPG
jgi:hypothetical protein